MPVEPSAQPNLQQDASSGNGAEATAAARTVGGEIVVELGGVWSLRTARPDHRAVLGGVSMRGKMCVTFVENDLQEWDSSLVLFVLAVRDTAWRVGVACDLAELPPAVASWLSKVEVRKTEEEPKKKKFWHWHFPTLTWIGIKSTRQFLRGHEMLEFLGECLLAAWQVIARPRSLRWSEVINQMRRAGANALGIVGLITFLVGVILAFVAAIQLRQFGADIFVADLIGLAMFREMGPMMAAIVLAGRTGAAYAAELGNMRLNEEIDALETFGIGSMSFLVMPRMIALVLMMPMLALYADFLGVAGGALVAKGVLNVPINAFVRQLEGAIHLNDVLSGLLKSGFFGFVVAYAGCLKGTKAERSAVGVGEATTAAVVLGILFIIIFDAGFTVIFDVLRI